MKVKSKCCKSFRKDGKACKRCPMVRSLPAHKLAKLADSIKKKRARKKFEDRYIAA